VELTKPQKRQSKRSKPIDTVKTHLRRIERREWQLWIVAILVSLVLLAGLMAFILPGLGLQENKFSLHLLPRVVQGLVALVLIFDIYTIFQQLQIHRMRNRLAEREELFRLSSANAADMVAVVDMDGRRIFNSDAYQKILGYSAEELKNSSSMDQTHPDDRERVKAAAAEARRTGTGKNLEYRIRCKNGTWLVLESTSSVIGDAPPPDTRAAFFFTPWSSQNPSADWSKKLEASPWARGYTTSASWPLPTACCSSPVRSRTRNGRSCGVMPASATIW
jgi:PAS domain S-box-containing protein